MDVGFLISAKAYHTLPLALSDFAFERVLVGPKLYDLSNEDFESPG